MPFSFSTNTEPGSAFTVFTLLDMRPPIMVKRKIMPMTLTMMMPQMVASNILKNCFIVRTIIKNDVAKLRFFSLTAISLLIFLTFK